MSQYEISSTCPCRLNQSRLERWNKIDIHNLRCTAEFADGSGRIYGKPLGAHPLNTSGLFIIIIKLVNL
jgi:hypothetical protein